MIFKICNILYDVINVYDIYHKYINDIYKYINRGGRKSQTSTMYYDNHLYVHTHTRTKTLTTQNKTLKSTVFKFNIHNGILTLKKNELWKIQVKKPKAECVL